MDAFLKLFGEVTLETVILLVAAIIFLAKVYLAVKDHLIERYEREQEQGKRIESILKQVNEYPKWRGQSLKIQDQFNKSIREIKEELKSQKEILNKTAKVIEENEATACRYRILRFNDELINEVYHTQEHFNQILDDVTRYEKYCEEHPDYENNKAILAIQNVKNTYKKCADKNLFL